MPNPELPNPRVSLECPTPECFWRCPPPNPLECPTPHCPWVPNPRVSLPREGGDVRSKVVFESSSGSCDFDWTTFFARTCAQTRCDTPKALSQEPQELHEPDSRSLQKTSGASSSAMTSAPRHPASCPVARSDVETDSSRPESTVFLHSIEGPAFRNSRGLVQF